ncbi:hypothetical protein ACOMHN_057248 [Nucella lapillus]
MFKDVPQRFRPTSPLLRLTLYLLLIGLASLGPCGFVQGTPQRAPLHIAGFFPITGEGFPISPFALPAARLAIEVLNNSTEVLPEFELELKFYDTEHSAKAGMRRYLDMINSGTTTIFMLGPGTSYVAVHVCVAAASWNIVQISPSAHSAALEDRELYPFFFRSIPSDAMLNTIRVDLLRHFRWSRVAIIYEKHSGNVYYGSLPTLARSLKQIGVEVLLLEAVNEQDYGDTINTLKAVMEGHFSINYLHFTTDNTSVLGMTVKEFRDVLGTESKYSAYTFDAMVSIGHVLHTASRDHGLNLSEFSYNNDTFSSVFVEELKKMETIGVSGPVAFDEFGNRLGVSVLEQCQGNKVPRDGPLRSHRTYFLPLPAVVFMSVLSSLGFSAACVFVAFNLKFASLPIIKLSSPNMNNVVSVGCSLGYVAVVMIGLDGRQLGAEGYSVVCHSLKDRQLILWIAGLVLLDVLYLCFWSVIDPMQRTLAPLPVQVDTSDPDHFVQPFIEKCTCKHGEYWLGVMLVYKGLLLVFGLFLAWETRHIQVKALNDSKYIGMSVYNLAVISIVSVLVGFLINDANYVGNYVISSFFIIIAITITLCFVFVPKIFAVHKNPKGEVSLGIHASHISPTTFHPTPTPTTYTLSGTQEASGVEASFSPSTSKVSPLTQNAFQIAIQRRLEKLVAERDHQIAQLKKELVSSKYVRESTIVTESVT